MSKAILVCIIAMLLNLAFTASSVKAKISSRNDNPLISFLRTFLDENVVSERKIKKFVSAFRPSTLKQFYVQTSN